MWGAQVSFLGQISFFYQTLTRVLIIVVQYCQHHMMPPYGTPVPYPAMYPPGTVYAHPGMPMVTLHIISSYRL